MAIFPTSTLVLARLARLSCGRRGFSRARWTAADRGQNDHRREHPRSPGLPATEILMVDAALSICKMPPDGTQITELQRRAADGYRRKRNDTLRHLPPDRNRTGGVEPVHGR